MIFKIHAEYLVFEQESRLTSRQLTYKTKIKLIHRYLTSGYNVQKAKKKDLFTFITLQIVFGFNFPRHSRFRLNRIRYCGVVLLYKICYLP